MGSGASKQRETGVTTDGEETTVFSTTTPLRFDPSFVEHLSQLPTDPNAPAPRPDAARQLNLDDHVRSRLRAEFERLQREEADVKAQISAALEKENLDRERSAGEGDRPLSSSETLLKDLEEVQAKVQRHRERRDVKAWPQVAKARQGVVQCLLEKKGRPLDCWREAEEFKQAVTEVEREFLSTLR